MQTPKNAKPEEPIRNLKKCSFFSQKENGKLLIKESAKN